MARIGGDKAGHDRWYERNIPRAEAIFARRPDMYLSTLRRFVEADEAAEASLPGRVVEDARRTDWTDHGHRVTPRGQVSPWRWSRAHLRMARSRDLGAS